MMFLLKSIRQTWTGMHIAIAAVCILAMMVSPAHAQNSWNEVGIIIDYGDDRTTWIWIPFEEHEIPVIDALNRSDLEMVTVGFGGMGEAICQIDDTGCPAADCRTRMCQTSSSSPFWRFMKLNDGEWSMVGTGVSGAKAIDGDIYALSWSSESPDLPVVALNDIIANAGGDRTVDPMMPALATSGESDRTDTSPDPWIPGVSVFGAIIIAAGVLILRAKSTAQATE